MNSEYIKLYERIEDIARVEGETMPSGKDSDLSRAEMRENMEALISFARVVLSDSTEVERVISDCELFLEEL